LLRGSTNYQTHLSSNVRTVPTFGYPFPHDDPGVDIQPKGQWLLHPYLFTQMSEREYGNDLRFASERERSSSGHLYALQPLIGLAYGLTDHIEVGASVTLSTFWNRMSIGQTRAQEVM
jgi:hypothetical protein